MNKFVSNSTLLEVGWRKSSHSGANGDCVELGEAGTTAYVRDSKDPEGPALAYTAVAWTGFVAALKAEGLQLG
ncbi:DUF397 domain-containing protein [Kitasatospora sp. RB6PN24]|uniref:DUF397 domain-containing protein n=1 Tax=Kitasatospora humi TaxID=2893891 RepID=UPI001E309E7E|nr:DUF397 domain-containing protein [Kitasatospora humi]MCC9307578.1 DUF397 domain-containing protein [Kitasatospora humi]